MWMDVEVCPLPLALSTRTRTFVLLVACLSTHDESVSPSCAASFTGRLSWRLNGKDTYLKRLASTMYGAVFFLI